MIKRWWRRLIGPALYRWDGELQTYWRIGRREL
jgi:hypothetical protein